MQILPKLALLATLAFPALSLAAYEVDLSGKVVDAAGKGVPQVEIALKGTAYKATTNAFGAWVLQKTATALLGPTLASARSLSAEQSAYSVSGRLVGDTRQLAQGVYVQKQAGSAVRSQALAKAAGEKDSLIVTYGTAEVGRLEQANLLQGKLADMMLLTVSPTLTQGTDNSTLAPQFRLLGQTVLVNYVYDASLWRPSVLTVGSTKTTVTAPAQKQFRVTLGAKEDAAVNLALVTRLQTIAVSDIVGRTYGDVAFDVSATASSGLAVDIVSTTLSVCSVSNGQVNLLAAGSCALKATQAGNSDYNAVEIAFKAFTIVPKTLTVAPKLGASLSKVYDGTTVNSATLVKDTHYELTGVVGAEVVDITVTGAIYNSANVANAQSVTATFSDALTGTHAGNYRMVAGSFELPATISKATLAFTSANPGSLFLASSPVAHAFSTNANAGVDLASSTPAVCNYSAGTLTLNSAGLCTITAEPLKAGNFTNSAQTQSFGVDRLYDERDGALYKIVKIGSQVWMAENLNYSRANTLGWCYNDNADSCLNDYGRLYQWTDAMDIASTYLTATAVDVAKNRTTDALVTAAGPNRGICPSGWHVPSDGEWTTLTNFVEAKDAVAFNAGAWLKAVVTGNDNWNKTSYNKQNTLGFSALPAGYFYNGGYWFKRGDNAYFWSASENYGSNAWYRNLNNDGAPVYRNGYFKNYGYSLRCLQD